MKIHKLLKAKKVFVSLAGEKIPVKLAYKIMKFVKAAETEEDFYNKEMQKIIDECCERDETGNLIISNDGKGYKIVPEKSEQCSKSTTELDETEIQPPETRFTLDELSELKMSVADMYNIDEFITE